MARVLTPAVWVNAAALIAVPSEFVIVQVIGQVAPRVLVRAESSHEYE